ncbi:uncharacterized protein LOC121378529 [Gigantopelta aegis]|uniref:uncharacterized protein LOC121378529 n=1 Tax=Gigantopelta aegis TaxID=1735272 RepID=UPI001B887453|nr:uncharacterized protein LOC121378529 [Gigantopelta aegis]
MGVTSKPVTSTYITSEHVTSTPITSTDITSELVTSTDITSELVTSTDITSKPVTSTYITSEPVTSTYITSEPVISTYITSQLLTPTNITSEPVTLTDVTSKPVTSIYITSEPLTSRDITSELVISTDITSTDITSTPVTSTDITSTPVTSTDITSEPVTSTYITSSTDIKLKSTALTDSTSEYVTSTGLTLEPVTSVYKSLESLKSTDLTSESVTSTDVTSDVVTLSDMTSESVNSTDITLEPVTSTYITSTNITSSSDLTSESVTSTDIKLEPMTSTDITSEPVTSTDITSEHVTSTGITLELVTSTYITSEPVTFTDIISEPVTSTDITSEPMTSTDITSEPVTSTDITSEPIISTDITSEPMTSTDISPSTSEVKMTSVVYTSYDVLSSGSQISTPILVSSLRGTPVITVSVGSSLLSFGITLQEGLSTSLTEISKTLAIQTSTGETSVAEYKGTMKVMDGAVWTPPLSDKTSAEYEALKLKIIAFLQKIFQNANLAKYIDHIVINGFSQGSIIVDFTVDFRELQVLEVDLRSMFNDGYQQISNPQYIIDTSYTAFVKGPLTSGITKTQQNYDPLNTATHVDDPDPLGSSATPIKDVSSTLKSSSFQQQSGKIATLFDTSQSSLLLNSVSSQLNVTEQTGWHTIPELTSTVYSDTAKLLSYSAISMSLDEMAFLSQDTFSVSEPSAFLTTSESLSVSELQNAASKSSSDIHPSLSGYSGQKTTMFYSSAVSSTSLYDDIHPSFGYSGQKTTVFSSDVSSTSLYDDIHPSSSGYSEQKMTVFYSTAVYSTLLYDTNQNTITFDSVATHLISSSDETVTYYTDLQSSTDNSKVSSDLMSLNSVSLYVDMYDSVSSVISTIGLETSFSSTASVSLDLACEVSVSTCANMTVRMQKTEITSLLPLITSSASSLHIVWPSETMDSVFHTQMVSLLADDGYQAQTTPLLDSDIYKTLTHSVAEDDIMPSRTAISLLWKTSNYEPYSNVSFHTAVSTDYETRLIKMVISSVYSSNVMVKPTASESALAESSVYSSNVINMVRPTALESVFAESSVYSSNVVMVKPTALESVFAESSVYSNNLMMKPTALESVFAEASVYSSNVMMNPTALESVFAESSVYSNNVVMAKPTALESVFAESSVYSSNVVMVKPTALESVFAESSVYSSNVVLVKPTALESVFAESSVYSSNVVMVKPTALESVFAESSVYSSNVVMVKPTALESVFAESSVYYTNVTNTVKPTALASALAESSIYNSNVKVKPSALSSEFAYSIGYYTSDTNTVTPTALDYLLDDTRVSHTNSAALESVLPDSSIYYTSVTLKPILESILFKATLTTDMISSDALLSPSYSDISLLSFETSSLDTVETSSMLSYFVGGLSTEVLFIDSLSAVSLSERILEPSSSFTAPCSVSSNQTCVHQSLFLTLDIEVSSPASSTGESSSLYIEMCNMNPCPQHSYCLSTSGSYLCECHPGYHMVDSLCKDVNECDTAPCPQHSVCTNTEGSFNCSCKPGFVEDDIGCKDVNECSSSPCPTSAGCVNTAGTFYCMCLPGFTEYQGACHDINECLIDKCHAHSTCLNNEGSYTCSCVSGYIEENGLCHDFDECESGPCPPSAVCFNNDGSYSCTCFLGYQMDQGSCTDIDECRSDVCGQNSLCVNTAGSYSCVCRSGFVELDGVCKDVNECLDNPCGENAVCLNSDASFTCQCLNGFRNDSGVCQDINECADIDLCGQYSVCNNMPGSYQCHCESGFELVSGTCTDENECKSSPCSENSMCVNVPGSFSCLCDKGYFLTEPLTCTECKVFNASLSVNKIGSIVMTYSSQYDDMESPAAANLSLLVTEAVTKVLTVSLGNLAYGSSMQQFRPGSVVADVTLFMNISYTGDVADLMLLILADNASFTSMNIFLDNNNTVVTDIDECSDPSWNDCSPDADCDNLIGTYTCSCRLQFTDYSPQPNKPGRICVAISENAQDLIHGVSVSITENCFPASESVNFTLWLTRGSHVTYVVDYGDGSTSTTKHNIPIAFLQPITFEHAFLTPDIYNVTVTIFNDVSSAEAQTDVCIEHTIHNLYLQVDDGLDEFTRIFTLSVSDASFVLTELFCLYSFGDGQTERVNISHLSFSNHTSTQHSYYIGDYTFEVICSNKVSSQKLESDVDVAEEIDGLNISVSVSVTRPSQSFVLSVYLLKGSNVTLLIDMGDGQNNMHRIENHRTGPTSFTKLQRYNSTGHYSVVVIARNTKSVVKADPVNITVLYDVKDLSVSVESPLPTPPGNIRVQVTYSYISFPPTFVTCRALVINSDVSRVTYADKISVNNNMKFVMLWHNSSNVGWHTLTMNCSNLISHQVIQTVFVIQAAIVSPYINVDKPYTVVGDSIKFQLGLTFGSHASFFVHFGDNTTMEGSFSELLIMNKHMNVPHAYNDIGFYTATLTVFNDVSSAASQLLIGVLEEVKGLQVKINYRLLDDSDVLTPGHGENTDVFPLERPIIFHVRVLSGNGLTYHWRFGNGSLIRTDSSVIEHKFDKEGISHISVNGSNALFFDVRVFSMNLYQTVLMHRLENDGPAEAYREMTFSLSLNRPGTLTCFTWNMGDNSPLVVYGQNHCKDNINVSSVWHPWSSSSLLTHTHVYHTNRTFSVSITGVNIVSMATETGVAVVSDVACHYPVVHIIGGGQQADVPVKKFRSEKIILESSVDIDCEVSSEANYVWSVSKVFRDSNILDYKFRPYDVDAFSSGLFKILFHPRTFTPGEYKITLNVSMKGIPGLFHTDFTYLGIQSTPLVARITGGSAWSVGYDSLLILDGLTESYDPDAGDGFSKKNMTFTWYCRQEGASFDDIADSMITIPSIDNETNSLWNSTGVCFGGGGGRIETSDAILKINTRLLGLGSRSVFRMEVRKGSRITFFDQTTVVVPGDPPHFQVKCLVNCHIKVNPSDQFSMLGICAQCHPLDSINYTWGLTIKNGTSGHFELVLDLESMLMSGFRSPSVVFLPNTLTGGQIYRLRLDARVHGFAPSLTEYEFITNLPPYGGSCEVEPTSGYALDTRFEIKCQQWLDPGQEESLGEGLLYRFWSTPRGGSQAQLLYYGTDPYTPQVQFPLGHPEHDYMFDVRVQIANPIGESADAWIQLQIKPPPVLKSMDVYLNMTSGTSSELHQMLLSGRDQEAKQMAVAVASLLGQTDNETRSVNITESVQKTEAELKEIEATMEDDRLKRVELRTTIVNILAETDSLTIDSVQQTALAFRVITEQTDELSDLTQNVTISKMTDMAESFKSIKKDSKRISVEQEKEAAKDIIASVSNIVVSVVNNVKKQGQNTGSSGSDILDEDQETTDYRQERVLITEALSVTDDIVKTMLKHQAPGHNALVFDNNLLTVQAEKKEASNLSNSVVSGSVGSFTIPPLQTFITDNYSSQFIDLKLMTFKTNPYLLDESVKRVNSPVVSLNLYNSDGSDILLQNLSEPFTISIDTPDLSSTDVKIVQQSLNWKLNMIYHSWNRTTTAASGTTAVAVAAAEALSITVDIVSSDIEAVDVFVRKGDYPSETVFDYHQSVELTNITEDDKTLVLFLNDSLMQTLGLGTFYIGFKEQVNQSDIPPDYSDYYESEQTLSGTTLRYNISFTAFSCLFWDETQGKWLSDGCNVSPQSTPSGIKCLCNHLTSFGAGVFSPPNQIDFNTVFDNTAGKLLDNSAVLVTLCVIVFLYLVGLVWTRRMDKKDVEKWGVVPLADNVTTDKYFYIISVFTGMRSKAGTHSKVSFILSGEADDTGVRCLADENGKKVLSRGSVQQFVLSVHACLGPLIFLRIWHDNSGKGNHQGWYLSKVVVSDVQTGASFFFLCNQWLAVEEGDGMIDRILPVAGSSDITTFNHLFFSQTKKSLTDSHLWISVISRPQRSNFSRVQRLSCILSLLLTTMLADAMFYRSQTEINMNYTLTLGPLQFSLNSLYVSFVSCIIVLPYNIAIDQIFRRSKPKISTKIDNGFLATNIKSNSELKPSVDYKTDGQSARQTAAKSPDPSVNSLSGIGFRDKDDMLPLASSTGRHKKTSRRLPHWCVYVAWFMILISVGVSSFFTFSYSMQWGKDKSNAWLTAMVLSVGESVLLIQPFKIIILAILLAWVVKKPDLDEIVTEEDIHINLLKADEELTHTRPTTALRPVIAVPPVDRGNLATAREYRLKEIQMFSVIKEVLFYLFFLAMLALVSIHNRDSSVYFAKQNIINMISAKSWKKINNTDDLWNWMAGRVLQSLYVTRDDANRTIDTDTGRAVGNMAGYRVGPVRMRQHRVRPDRCLLHPLFGHGINHCTVEWSWDTMDTKTYNKGWTTLKHNLTSRKSRNWPWLYLTDEYTNGIPYTGRLGSYPSGGYIQDLIGGRQRVMTAFQSLRNNQWIDEYTRAVFVEFNLYNPNINKFSTVLICVELHPVGLFVTNILVRTMTLFPYLGAYGIVVALTDACCAVCVSYLMVREMKKLVKQRCSYFREFWNTLQFALLLASIIALAMYIGRYVLTEYMIRKVVKLRDKFHNFQRLALWEELFSYLLAMVMFTSILKMIHLLRFNKRITVLAATFRMAAHELRAFSVIFIVFLMAFASASYTAFGRQVQGYRSLLHTLESLLSFALGEYQYQELYRVNRIVGPVFFIAYIIFIILILINIFVAILNDSFAVVRLNITKIPNDYEIVRFIWTRVKQWSGIDLSRFMDDLENKYSTKSSKEGADSPSPSRSLEAEPESTLHPDSTLPPPDSTLPPVEYPAGPDSYSSSMVRMHYMLRSLDKMVDRMARSSMGGLKDLQILHECPLEYKLEYLGFEFPQLHKK